ncbi:carbohydrate ABC transporter permease [Streptomyces sp. KR80]|uniref:carbohydrate ABC transporter permease n=1 Tax=Streptomyces sp. KR80 TaxID=3457426 RepID=UPI003FD0FC75
MQLTDSAVDAPRDETPVRRRSPNGTPGRAGSGEGGRFFNAFSHGFLILWSIMAAGPLLWAAMTSLKKSGDILESPWSLPLSPHLPNFVDAWTTAHIGQYFLNTLIIVGGSLTGTMLLSSMAAYALARFEFPGNRFIYFLFIAGMCCPVVLALVPLFFVLKNMMLLNTFHGLILVYIAYSLPFSVFFLTSFFRSLPSSVAEAAMIDGASHLRILFQVMLPMAKPGLISIGMFNFLGQWNQYLIPQVLNPDQERFVLPQGLAMLAVNQGYKGDWGALFAGLILATIPLLVFYLLFQKQVQAGLTAGALK